MRFHNEATSAQRGTKQRRRGKKEAVARSVMFGTPIDVRLINISTHDIPMLLLGVHPWELCCYYTASSVAAVPSNFSPICRLFAETAIF